MRSIAFLLYALSCGLATGATWQLLSPDTTPTKRHEAAFVEVDGKFYLLGGRGIKPVEVYDPVSNKWTAKSPTPIELHHFQALAVGKQIYVVGAFTGPYPNEKPVPVIYIYTPATDVWTTGATIPKQRRRGAAGAVLHDGAIYVVCGIVEGHLGHFVPWVDKYDLTTNTWTTLADAPRPRDHYQAVVVANQIVAAGGRISSGKTKQVFQLTVPQIDVYDIGSNSWRTLKDPLPTPRAGCFAVAVGDRVVIAGGESGTQGEAHHEVDVLDLAQETWTPIPRLATPRHGTGLVYWGGRLYTAAGCARRGGSPEQDSIEALAWQP